tara:strand:+ start:1518 stop:1838 length:321 start_codon:yes stop_codon:yes gene_type:complete
MDTTQIKKVLAKASETMTLAAQHYKDKGATKYTAELHCGSVGYAMAQAVKGGMEANSANLGAMVHALYNHSAWRQKFEKAGIFEKAQERSFENMAAGLEEEFGGSE